MTKRLKKDQYRYDNAYMCLYEWDEEAQSYLHCYKQNDHHRNTKRKTINDFLDQEFLRNENEVAEQWRDI